MSHDGIIDKVTGWNSTTPVPNNHTFEPYVTNHNGRLFYHDIDLAQMGDGDVKSGPKIPGEHRSLKLTYLPAVRARVRNMIDAFDAAAMKTNYKGKFVYAYASKANAMEEVMKAAETAGAHQETSALYDVYVLQHERNLLPADRKVICNGFKLPGTQYLALICSLIKKHANTIPIIDDIEEVAVYGQLFVPHKVQVGIRLKCWGMFSTPEEMEKCDCRFGFTLDQALVVAEEIAKYPNLELRVLHAMVGSPVWESEILKWKAPLEAYAMFKKRFPTIDHFDFGGGMPSALCAADSINYSTYMEALLTLVNTECSRHGVEVPTLIGEFGRYSVADHGVQMFQVVRIRNNNSPSPYYIINGSIMSSFPDTWALKEHFTVLPVNYLDRPFQEAKLGGATCDSDDMYPPHYTNSKLYLPVVSEDELKKTPMWVAVFNVGAYQRMLGGIGGAKHCGIPESDEVIFDRNSPSEKYTIKTMPGQSLDYICHRLHYNFHMHQEKTSGESLFLGITESHGSSHSHNRHKPPVSPTI